MCVCTTSSVDPSALCVNPWLAVHKLLISMRTCTRMDYVNACRCRCGCPLECYARTYVNVPVRVIPIRSRACCQNTEKCVWLSPSPCFFSSSTNSCRWLLSDLKTTAQDSWKAILQNRAANCEDFAGSLFNSLREREGGKGKRWTKEGRRRKKW